MKTRKLTPNKAHPGIVHMTPHWNYTQGLFYLEFFHHQLKSIALSGFNNVYSLSALGKFMQDLSLKHYAYA